MNATDHYPTLSPDEGEISLVEIANAVLRNWRLVVVLPALLALAAGVWSLTRERMYAASASFTPQAPEGRGAGAGAAALAQQFGVSLGAERPSQSPDFYLDLLRAKIVLHRAVEAEYQIPTEEGRVWKGTLVQYWDLDERGGPVPPSRRARELLREAISASLRRETGVVSFSVSADNPVLAERIAETLLKLMNDFNLEARQSRAKEEGRFISERMTEAQSALLAAEGGLQNFLRQNREFRNSPELVFAYDRLQRQVMLWQEVYTSLLRSREQARIDAVRDIPLITVIDNPAGMAEPQGRGTFLRAIVAFIAGLILAVSVAFLMEFSRRSRETDNRHYREFQNLGREAWDDLRHPRRWIRRGEKRVRTGEPERVPDGNP